MSGVNFNDTDEKAGSPVTTYTFEEFVSSSGFKMGPTNPPTVNAKNNLIYDEYTVATDIAFASCRIAENYKSGGEFFVHWTKSQDTDQSTKTVKWQLTYVVYDGEAEDGAAAGTVVSDQDTYDDAGTTTRIVNQSGGMAIVGLAAGKLISFKIEAIVPTGTALVEPALVSLGIRYTAKTAKTDV